MKVRAFIIITILWVLSCNQVNDLSPVDPDAEPTAAVEVVKTRFPDAKDLVFRTLVPSKVWEVAFSSGIDKYTSLVDATAMSETFRATPDTIPVRFEELMPRSSFDGGTISGNSEDIDLYNTYNRRNKLKYSLNGYYYFLEWYRNAGAPYTPVLAIFDQNWYRIGIRKVGDFPLPIREYLAARKELEFVYGEVRVKVNDEKQFWLQVFFMKNNKQESGFLLLDEKGNQVWSSREFNQPIIYNPNSNIDTLPEPIQRHLDQSPELTKFFKKPEDIYKWKGEYEGVVSYYLKLSHNINNTSEVCELYFDKDGNLLNRRYFVSF